MTLSRSTHLADWYKMICKTETYTSCADIQDPAFCVLNNALLPSSLEGSASELLSLLPPQELGPFVSGTCKATGFAFFTADLPENTVISRGQDMAR